jgi:hypothetical protein
MKRRTILSIAALAPLAACAGQTPSQIAAEVVSDAGLIASGFTAEMPLITALTGVPAATLATFSGYLSSAIAVAKSVSADLTVTAAVPLVQQIGTYVSDALALATTAPLNGLLPPGVLPVLEAASALLPVLEAAVGMAGASTAPALMAPDVARATLRAA